MRQWSIEDELFLNELSTKELRERVKERAFSQHISAKEAYELIERVDLEDDLEYRSLYFVR